MIKVFTFDIYALLDPSASLYFLTPYVAMKFDIIPKQLLKPFTISTHVCDSIRAYKIYHDYVNSVNHKDTMVDLVELNMVDFDVLLNMDLFHACYALIDYRTRVVKFQFPKESVIKWTSNSLLP